MAKSTKPNILVIWGDDIGIWNLSCYSRGMMGYRTPNIDRIAAEGMLFTDSYGEQSCTAGRAAFIRPALYMIGAAGAIVEEFLATFKEYPPRQRAATFTIDQALEKMKEALSGAHH